MTTPQLTEQDIEEMERAERAAEAGPWDTDTSVCVVTSQESDIASVEYPGDARFIARARSFVPAAIADLRRLREENERLARERDEAVTWRRCADILADEVDVLVRRKVLDMRSPAADALLDYREPPSSPRSCRMAELERDLTAATERAERAERERDELLAELAEHMPIAITAMKLSADQARMGDLRDIIDAVSSATPEQRLANLAELRKEQP